MTDQQHPITPSPEFVEQWYDAIDNQSASWKQQLATRAAQWGADQELEACCEHIGDWFATPEYRRAELRAARRPKPPSLKQQALALVEQHEDGWRPAPKDWDTIRRALEALPND
jgi:hypothetical protein